MALTLTTHDTRFDDPDGATIAKVLASLDGGRNVLATLERSALTYLQAEGSVRTGFTLESLEGSLDRRYRARAGGLPLAQVTEIFQGYAGGGASWRQSLEWDHVPFVRRETKWYNTWVGYLLALVAAAALIWLWHG
jgi:hypothetical protein